MVVEGENKPMDSAASAAQSGRASQTGTARVKRGMAEMLKGGVIMDVVTPEQARIAEGAGAVAVMALERVPAEISDTTRHTGDCGGKRRRWLSWWRVGCLGGERELQAP